MDGSQQLWEAVGDELKSPVRTARRIAGGDISHAFIAHLMDGRRVFCKSKPRSTPGLFHAEAEGLRFIRVPDGPRVPEVIAYRDAPASPSFLILEAIDQGHQDRAAQIRTGEAIAALHSSASESRFGLEKHNFIGTLRQDNDWLDAWPRFFVERRLWPQIQQCKHTLGRSLMRTLDRVIERTASEIENGEAPCRVHGDLWSGNRLIDDQGQPCLIDPAAFHGHRELDLAMMKLFGGFSEHCIEAYEQSLPLVPGASRRMEFYHLYFLLVHVNLHGPSWAGQVAQVAWGLS